MKQSLRQKQKLSVKITASLGNQIKLLSLSGFEISSKLNDLIDDYFDEDDKKIAHFKDEYLIDRYKNVLYQGNDYQNILTEESDSDIRQKLMQQLQLTPFDEVENLIGEYLIDSVESNGRLDPEINYEDIKSIVFEDLQNQISDKDIDKVLRIIQNFEPPGCAFRNINESLYIQIENLELSNQEKITLKETLGNLIQEKTQINKLSEKVKKNLDKLRKTENFNKDAKGHNPLCGDKVHVYLKLDEDKKVQDISFEGQGCAISMASASIMTDLVKGKEEQEVKEIVKDFLEMIKEKDKLNNKILEENEKTKLMCLSGVKKYPMRVKCATLSWHTLTSAIDNTQEEINSEKFD